ncbi:MAG TPA: short-chain dehydrogenase, partial [Aequorivita sp.]|nr:short-chain dehydrogenase [Aequorivita sp.]
IKVNNSDEIKTDSLGLFANDGEEFTIEATDDTVVLVLSGEPINEPIAAQGPFVMNTRSEIVQAISDFNMGKFGYLE